MCATGLRIVQLSQAEKYDAHHLHFGAASCYTAYLLQVYTVFVRASKKVVALVKSQTSKSDTGWKLQIDGLQSAQICSNIQNRKAMQ